MNGDIADVFVFDDYLSTDATSAIADLMVRGMDQWSHIRSLSKGVRRQ